MAFDMMALMNDKSKAQAAGKGKYELQNIPLEKMIPNPANELIYETGEIEELARSILLTGKVLQNAVVAAADENGNHVIIAGHRRRLACMKLVEEGHSEFNQMPCMVMTEPDDLLQELFLIQTNSTARVLSEAEKMRQAERATAILNQFKERKQISGRVRDIAAKMLGTTTGQLARYNVISKGLTNEVLREAFENGDIGISVAYEAARISEEEQAELAEQLKQGHSITIRDIVERQKAAELQKAAEESDMALPMQMQYMLHIKPRFNISLVINYVEKDGKYYAGYDYRSPYSGAGSGINYNFPYESSQKAIEGLMVELSHYYHELHVALWESGYSIVGRPAGMEIPAEVPAQVYALAIKKKFKANVEIYWLEHAGKFYAGYRWSMTNNGGSCYPNPKYDYGYDTKQEAIEETIKSLAQDNKGLHEAIWGSGYALVGEPAAKESPAESKELVTDKTTHDNEAEPQTEAPAEAPADDADLEIEDLRTMWLRKRALGKVVDSLKSTKEYYLLQADVGAGEENNTRVKASRLNIRVETSRLVAEIYQEYIRAAKEEITGITTRLGDWEELFDQEAGKK